MYKKVLVPLDGSPLAESVLNHVREIARSLKSEVVLLSVVTSALPPFYASQISSAIEVYTKAEADFEAWLKSYLDGVAQRLQKDGISTISVVLKGNAAERIIDYATENNIDLIIMSRHGGFKQSRWPIGNVADKVTCLSPAPVMLVPTRG